MTEQDDIIHGATPVVEDELDPLTELIGIVVAWHEANTQMLQHMMSIPGNGDMTVEYEGKPMQLQGDLHKGFIMGLTTAMGMFSKLPFEPVAIPDGPTH